jgi:four helix bundle protein
MPSGHSQPKPRPPKPNGATEFDLEERLLDLAATIIRLSDSLPRSPAGSHIADQLIRSGTSPMAHHGEAQSAESRKDFIHKISIALKELRETHRWLKLIHRVPLIKDLDRLSPILQETEELIRIFNASLTTARRNQA